MVRGPAYRIETQRLVVRAVDPADAAELADVIASNQHHLRPWIEWARDEARTHDAMLESTRRMRGRFDLGEAFTFVLVEPKSARIVGGAALGPVPADASASIGYWLAESATGQGYATEAVSALVRVAFEVENLELVEIHTASDNERSAKVARRVGFQHDGTLRARLRSEDGRRSDRAVFSILKPEYPRTHAAGQPIRACDVIGRPLVEPARASGRSAFR